MDAYPKPERIQVVSGNAFAESFAGSASDDRLIDQI